jgi:hypothetical protein
VASSVPWNSTESTTSWWTTPRGDPYRTP